MIWFESVIECERQMLTMWISENVKEHIIKPVLRYSINMYIIMRITKFNSYKYVLLLGMVINTAYMGTLDWHSLPVIQRILLVDMKFLGVPIQTKKTNWFQGNVYLSPSNPPPQSWTSNETSISLNQKEKADLQMH